MRRLFAATILAVLVATPGVVIADEPDAPRCSLQLSVEFDPGVPNVADPGFLSSLVGNHLSYSLVIVQQLDDSNARMELFGPGSPQNCLEVLDAIRRDARVERIEVL